MILAATERHQTVVGRGLAVDELEVVGILGKRTGIHTEQIWKARLAGRLSLEAARTIKYSKIVAELAIQIMSGRANP